MDLQKENRKEWLGLEQDEFLKAKFYGRAFMFLFLVACGFVAFIITSAIK